MLSLQAKKILRKVLRIKFENIFLILNLCLFTYAIIYHITLNGFNIVNVLLEMFMYYSMTFTLSYCIKDTRKELKKDLQ